MIKAVHLTLWICLSWGIAGMAFPQEEKWIRVSLIEASRSEDFSVDKKIQSLEKHLKQMCTGKDTPDVLKSFRRFSPIAIAKARPVEFEKAMRIALNKPESLFLDITIYPLRERHYPAAIRWFTRTADDEKDIITIPELKFYPNRCLFLFDGKDLTPETSSFKLIAVEFVPKPVNESEPNGSQK